MGTKDRRRREVAEREQLFLDTARELIVQDGLLNLQMARVAEACDYATGTLYQHFTSKEDLLVAIACDKAAIRAAMYNRAACWQAASRDRNFGVAVADMIFARRYPDYFRLAQYVFTGSCGAPPRLSAGAKHWRPANLSATRSFASITRRLTLAIWIDADYDSRTGRGALDFVSWHAYLGARGGHAAAIRGT